MSDKSTDQLIKDALSSSTRAISKNKDFDDHTKREVYNEIFKLAINPKILVDGHIFVEFKKEKELSEIGKDLKSYHKKFGVT